MDIISLTHCHPGDIGGIQTYNRNLAKIFTENIRFLYYLPPYSKKSLSENGFNAKCFGGYKSKVLSIIKYLLHINNECKDANVIIIHFPFLLIFLRKKLLNGKKVIVVQHNQYQRIIREPIFKFKFFSKILSYFTKAAIKSKADTFVVLSESDKSEIRNKLNSDIHICPIYHHSELTEVKNKKYTGKTVLMIARMFEQKRIDIACETAKIMPQFKFQIYGDGELLEDLKEKYSSVVNIEFKGVTHEVERVLDENSIFLFTSDFEGFPIAGVEALKRALPIVSRDCFCGVHELVDGNGIVVDSSDPGEIAEAIRQVDQKFAEYSRNSFPKTAKFSWTCFRNKWEEIITDTDK